MSDWSASAPPSRPERFRAPAGLVALAVATLLLSLGESLWARFVPRYLEALGATVVVVGLWGSLSDLLDAGWQVPGGALADRKGGRFALLALTVASLAGMLFVLVPSWPIVLLGLSLWMASSAFAQPATFAAIGETLRREGRATGFGVQSALKRLPLVIGAPAAGFLITERLGVVHGVQAGILAALLLGITALAVLSRGYRSPAPPPVRPFAFRIRDLSPSLRRLLLSDILVRFGESLTKVFVVLYVVLVLGHTDLDFGLVLALQALVAILSYGVSVRAADRGARKPWVALTFLFFAIYPLALLPARETWLLAAAFAVGGLREIGEPARKASIVDAAPDGYRGRVVGAYYAVRGLAILPAGLLGGLLWTVDPRLPFFAGAAVGLAGLALYVLTVPNE